MELVASGAVDRGCLSIERKIQEWLAGKADGSPKILIDKGERSPYKDFQESKGPLNQIHIRTREGKLVDIKARSEIVAAIETFKYFRVYVSEEDAESVEFVQSQIESEAENVHNS